MQKEVWLLHRQHEEKPLQVGKHQKHTPCLKQSQQQAFMVQVLTLSCFEGSNRLRVRKPGFKATSALLAEELLWIRFLIYKMEYNDHKGSCEMLFTNRTLLEVSVQNCSHWPPVYVEHLEDSWCDKFNQARVSSRNLTVRCGHRMPSGVMSMQVLCNHHVPKEEAPCMKPGAARTSLQYSHNYCNHWPGKGLPTLHTPTDLLLIIHSHTRRSHTMDLPQTYPNSLQKKLVHGWLVG